MDLFIEILIALVCVIIMITPFLHLGYVSATYKQTLNQNTLNIYIIG